MVAMCRECIENASESKRGSLAAGLFPKSSLNRDEQFLEREWFVHRHHVIESFCALLATGEQHRQTGLEFPQLGNRLGAGHHGHRAVGDEQTHFVGMSSEHGDGFRAIRRFQHAITKRAKLGGDQFADGDLVVCHQDQFAMPALQFRRGGCS